MPVPIRKRSGVLISLGVTVIAAAVAFFFSGAAPVRIGFVAQLTGAYGDLGVQGRNGLVLALEQFQQRTGKKIELLVREISNDAVQSQRTFQQLHNAGVSAVIGPMTSGQSGDLLATAVSNRLVLISPTASSPVLSGLDDYFFRLQPSTEQAAGELGRFAVLRQGVSRMAVLYDADNSIYSLPFTANFSNAVSRAGGRILCVRRYRSSDAKERTIFVRRLLEKRPGGVLLVSSARDTAVWMELLKQQGFRGKVFLSGWARTDALFRFGRSAVDGAYIGYTQVTKRDSPRFRRFMKAYYNRFGQYPSFAATAAYDTAGVLLFVLQRKSADLKTALLQMPPWHGVGGVFQFDRFGDVYRAVEIGQIINGSIRVLLVTGGGAAP